MAYRKKQDNPDFSRENMPEDYPRRRSKTDSGRFFYGQGKIPRENRIKRRKPQNLYYDKNYMPGKSRWV